MRVADNSRGEYHYAADIADITARLDQEMTTLETTTITDLYLAARGLDGAVIQDVFSVRPAMTMFEEIFTEDGWWRTRVGDVSSESPVGIMVQVAPARASSGVPPDCRSSTHLDQSTGAGGGHARQRSHRSKRRFHG